MIRVYRWLLIGLVVLAPACETTPEERAATACTVLCGCSQPQLPALQDRCVADCSNQISMRLSNECIACISANSNRCATIEDVCRPICNPPPTNDGLDGGL